MLLLPKVLKLSVLGPNIPFFTSVRTLTAAQLALFAAVEDIILEQIIKIAKKLHVFHNCTNKNVGRCQLVGLTLANIGPDMLAIWGLD